MNAREPAEAEVDVEGRSVRLTSLDRVLFPSGFTKRDLVRYHLSVAPVLVPQVRGRPLTMRRFPEGVAGTTWFQTRCRGRPEWMRTHPIPVKGGEVHDYCVVDDVAGLVWMANLATVELHPFLWTIEEPLRPSWIVFDLDPGPEASTADACRIALRVRERVTASAWPKSSGLRGVHVHVPNDSSLSHDEAKAQARRIAAELSRDDPRLVTDRMPRAGREAKVFVDWSQNDPGKSTVAAWSLRAAMRPRVAVPLAWDEIEAAAAGDLELAFGPDEALERARLSLRSLSAAKP